MERIDALKRGTRIAFIATSVTLFLAIMKALVGYLFDSKLLIADAFHSSADLLAISASGFGLWLASKKKTQKFPYGFYRAETLVSLIIGGLIVWGGITLFIDGYQKLFHISDILPQQNFDQLHGGNLSKYSTNGKINHGGLILEFPFLPVGVSIISIITAFFIAKQERVVGKAIGSQSLLVNASESFLDIFASIIVLLGLLLAYAKIPYIEGSIIILISFLIIKLGLTNAWTSLLFLMDANLDPKLQTEIENKINEIYGVKGESEVKIRQSGPFKMVECRIETSPSLPLYRAHELADKVEDYVMKNYEHIESVFIHIEPSIGKSISAIIPVHEINGLDSKVYEHFGRAPYFVILRLKNSDVEIEDFYYNEFIKETKHIGIKVIRAVIKYKLDLLFTSRIGEISFYMLKDNFVDIYRISKDLTVKEVIDKYLKNEFKQIYEPTHTVEESQIEKLSE
ncbi:MAG: cation diffusion facilitator family transporter [Spirochaetota bacterium]|nr:cation diffusion facilitator family transporter [Spirochaetota bacterium]